jgi:hypothetical protein
MRHRQPRRWSSPCNCAWRAPNPPAYPGAGAGVLQRAAYPDIVPLVLPVPPAGTRQVDNVARRWAGTSSRVRRPTAGSGGATSEWFGFHGDIVVRIADGTGSRVDIAQEPRQRVRSRRQRQAHRDVARLKAADWCWARGKAAA